MVHRTYYSFNEVEEVIKKSGFGRKVSLTNIVKNKAKVGFKKFYECDD